MKKQYNERKNKQTLFRKKNLSIGVQHSLVSQFSATSFNKTEKVY